MGGEVTYGDKIFQHLIDMKVGDEFLIEKNVHPSNREKFVDVIKSFIASNRGSFYGFYVEFSNDHSKIRKFEILKAGKEKSQISADDWSEEIKSLEDHFNSIALPCEPVSLNQHTKIIDVKQFVEGHIRFARNNNGNRIFKGYFDRLNELKEVLISKKSDE